MGPRPKNRDDTRFRSSNIDPAARVRWRISEGATSAHKGVGTYTADWTARHVVSPEANIEVSGADGRTDPAPQATLCPQRVYERSRELVHRHAAEGTYI